MSTIWELLFRTSSWIHPWLYIGETTTWLVRAATPGEVQPTQLTLKMPEPVLEPRVHPCGHVTCKCCKQLFNIKEVPLPNILALWSTLDVRENGLTTNSFTAQTIQRKTVPSHRRGFAFKLGLPPWTKCISTTVSKRRYNPPNQPP